eukprot:m.586634 g.586634  ORF g.586634 m.586634 type:complete len:153 (+) comp22346_c0_seq6:485-943(+)
MVRLKHRYLLCELVFADDKVDTSIKRSEISSVIKDAVGHTHGDYGIACILGSFQVKYFNVHTRTVLLRISRDHYEVLWSSMTLVSSFKKRECFFRVLHLAGTIRSCQKHLLRFNLEQLGQLAAATQNIAERRKIEQMILDLSIGKVKDVTGN